ncbi:MAG TPA: DnaJ C-terminal domain-containing protein, partial [Ktedonobacteraceae bacterium]
EVKIPAGVTDGARIRMAGQGTRGPGGRGDLYLRVHVRPDPQFTREGTTDRSGGDVRVRQRPVLEFCRILALEPQRLRIVTLEQGDKECKRQEMMRSKLEKLDIVMHRQRFALFVGELLPRAVFALGQIQDNIRPLGLPPDDGPSWVCAVALNQLRVAVNREKELVEKVLAHASTPFGYQVK